MKLLFLGGYSRSGSTLLGRVLGEPAGAVCVGETRFLWSRGLIDNVDCGCGEPFRSCRFWAEVADRAFGGWERVDARRLAEVDRVTNLLTAMPCYAVPRLRPRVGEMIVEYGQALARLFEAIAATSGASTIIETSKHPTFACLLREIAGADVRLLHLVRDSRAVAYSWTRRRHLTSPIAGQHFMPQFGIAETATKWLAWNATFHALSRSRTPYLRIGYEDFVSDPRATLARTSEFAGQQLLPSEENLTATAVNLAGHHIFSGNPMRDESGWLPIRLDNEWQTALTRAQIAEVTTITWPLLCRYGYLTPGARRGLRARAL